MSTTSTSDQQFDDDVLKAAGPVLVDFWAEWCGPCKAIAPALEEIAGEMSGRMTVAKINIDENPMTPQKYGVKGLPTLILFKDGKIVTAEASGKTKEINKILDADEGARYVGEFALGFNPETSATEPAFYPSPERNFFVSARYDLL